MPTACGVDPHCVPREQFATIQNKKNTKKKTVLSAVLVNMAGTYTT